MFPTLIEYPSFNWNIPRTILVDTSHLLKFVSDAQYLKHLFIEKDQRKMNDASLMPT